MTKDTRYLEDRINDPQMTDGRPLSAWKAELLFARQDRERLKVAQKQMEDKFVALRLIEYAISERPYDLNLVFVVRRDAALNPLDMARHPEKFVEFEEDSHD